MFTALLFALCAAEMVLGGPGYWIVAGVSIRRALFVVLMSWMVALVLAGRVTLRRGHVLLLLSLAIVLIVWAVIIPSMHRSEQLKLAIQEGLPLAFGALGVLGHAFFTEHPDKWALVRKSAGYSLALTAVASVAMWLAGTALGSEWPLVSVAAKTYFTLGDLEAKPSLFIGQMPDGFFRVMWVTSLLFIPALLACWANRNRLGVFLFGAALFASYTRAFWAVTALAMIVALFLTRRVEGVEPRRARRRVTAAVSLVVVAALAFEIASEDDSSATARALERISETRTDDSTAERVNQVGPLIAGWERAPVLGKGLGSVASIVRSEQAPYLYELTYVALLMKMGLVGLLALLAFPLALMLDAASRRRPMTRQRAAVWASLLSVLLASATNPYLINLVGMGTLGFLFIDLDVDPHPSASDGVVQG